MSVINNIDYDHLTHLAKTSRVPSHKLCERAEKGLPLNNLVEEDPNEWVGYPMVSQLLSSPYSTLLSLFTQQNDLDYWGIEWKSRSLVKAKGKRGCGVLFKRTDITLVNSIRVGAHISLMAALKVFQAIRQGKIPTTIRMTDEELALELGTDLPTVLTHRRD